jgi:hypothetical protein
MNREHRIYLIDHADPRNADYLAGRAQSFVLWLERSSIESAKRTIHEFKELDLTIVIVELDPPNL